jgi:predicted metal-dependent hydrolase
MCVKPESIGIRKMKTRLGSCNNIGGNIWFILSYLKKPEKYKEYIVVHELVNLFERNHNKIFVLPMNQLLPDWKERKNNLMNCHCKY